jgi:hypothetical protein
VRRLVGATFGACQDVVVGTASVPVNQVDLFFMLRTVTDSMGLLGLEPGAPADAVVYAEDSRLDLNQLASPIAVILRGRCVRGGHDYPSR